MAKLINFSETVAVTGFSYRGEIIMSNFNIEFKFGEMFQVNLTKHKQSFH